MQQALFKHFRLLSGSASPLRAHRHGPALPGPGPRGPRVAARRKPSDQSPWPSCVGFGHGSKGWDRPALSPRHGTGRAMGTVTFCPLIPVPVTSAWASQEHQWSLDAVHTLLY